LSLCPCLSFIFFFFFGRDFLGIIQIFNRKKRKKKKKNKKKRKKWHSNFESLKEKKNEEEVEKWRSGEVEKWRISQIFQSGQSCNAILSSTTHDSILPLSFP